MKATIVLLPGDGIGPEVVREARVTLETIAARFGHDFEFAQHLIGGSAIDRTGSALPPDDPPPVPTAIDIFGGEIVPFPKPPRELAERYFRIAGWAEHARGGHFPAVTEPQLLAERLREAFRPCRQA